MGLGLSFGNTSLVWNFGRLFLEYQGLMIRLLSGSILQSI